MCPLFGMLYTHKLHRCGCSFCLWSGVSSMPFWKNCTPYQYNDCSNSIDGSNGWCPVWLFAGSPPVTLCPCQREICHSLWRLPSNRQQQIDQLRWLFHVRPPQTAPRTQWYCLQWPNRNLYKRHPHVRNLLRCRTNRNFYISIQMPWLWNIRDPIGRVTLYCHNYLIDCPERWDPSNGTMWEQTILNMQTVFRSICRSKFAVKSA